MKERQIRRNSTIQLINANDHVRDESRHARENWSKRHKWSGKRRKIPHANETGHSKSWTLHFMEKVDGSCSLKNSAVIFAPISTYWVHFDPVKPLVANYRKACYITSKTGSTSSLHLQSKSPIFDSITKKRIKTFFSRAIDWYKWIKTGPKLLE